MLLSFIIPDIFWHQQKCYFYVIVILVLTISTYPNGMSQLVQWPASGWVLRVWQMAKAEFLFVITSQLTLSQSTLLLSVYWCTLSLSGYKEVKVWSWSLSPSNTGVKNVWSLTCIHSTQILSMVLTYAPRTAHTSIGLGNYADMRPHLIHNDVF